MRSAGGPSGAGSPWTSLWDPSTGHIGTHGWLGWARLGLFASPRGRVSALMKTKHSSKNVFDIPNSENRKSAIGFPVFCTIWKCNIGESNRAFSFCFTSRSEKYLLDFEIMFFMFFHLFCVAAVQSRFPQHCFFKIVGTDFFSGPKNSRVGFTQLDLAQAGAKRIV